MKVYLISSVFVLFQSVYFSQDITGKWYGLLKVNKIEVRIDLNIVRTEGGYVSTMDSPDQGALGVFVDTTEFKNPDFRFKIVKGGIEFRGEYTAKNTIKGLFSQRGMSIPLEFGREEFGYSEDAGAELNRKPQEPFKPYSYYTEEVTFLNKKDKVMLSGTFPVSDGPDWGWDIQISTTETEMDIVMWVIPPGETGMLGVRYELIKST